MAASAATRWNQRPAYTNAPLLGKEFGTQAALHSAGVYGSVALLAAGASRYGLPLLSLLSVPVTGLGAALVLAVLVGAWGVLRAASSWRDSNTRSSAQAGLGPAQRKLLGLPLAPPPRPSATPEAAPAAARAAALLATPVNPSQRLAPLTPSSLADGSSARHLLGATPGSAGRSSWTASPGPRLSPWSTGPAVATADQLRGYIDAYSSRSVDHDGDAAGLGGAAGAAGAGLGGGGGGLGSSPAAAAAAAAAGSPLSGGAAGYYAAGAAGGGGGGGGGGDAVDQGFTGSPALPIGRDAPSYRPSMLPRKAASGPGAAGAAEGLQPSADAEAGRIMRETLKMEVFQLVSCIERFREWASCALLAPLAELVVTAHVEPNAALRRLASNSEQAPQLPPITALLGVDTGTDSTGQLAAGGGGGQGSGSYGAAGALNPSASLFSQALSVLRGRGGGAGGGGGGGPAGGGSAGDCGSAVEDACGLARSLMDRLRVGQLPYGYDPQPIILSLHRYCELLLVLSGRRPGELLPPAPASYIANRVWALAQGSCAKDFNWNGGGEHAGQPWSPDLPSDSGLLFYLFAAFLDAPGWNFPPPGAAGAESSRGAPLYLGSMRSQRQSAYSALLAFRPDKPGPEAVAVIGSNLASRAPRFSLMCGGQQITLSERDGLFKVLLMWLKYHVEKRQGLVGGRFLNEAALGGLQGVLETRQAGPSIPQRVFNWWFPANQ